MELLKLVEESLSLLRNQVEVEKGQTVIDTMIEENLKTMRNLMTPSDKKPHCCKLGCKEQAKWEIWHGNTPDDYTHSCTKHIGDLLTNAYKHSIYALDSSPQLEQKQKTKPSKNEHRNKKTSKRDESWISRKEVIEFCDKMLIQIKVIQE